jgi:hypothetical protein
MVTCDIVRFDPATFGETSFFVVADDAEVR